uniref:DNA mismatch repair protein MutS core domain-containing protein n=1 Tax=Globodera rostochiensis TaxID=31243 RepID=A0A914IC35_GLORO
MCDRIRSILSNLHDLQQLISLCTFINVEQNASREDSKRVIRNKIIQVIELKRLLDAIKQLSEVIGRSKSSFFIQTKSRLDDCRLQAIAEFVNDKISPELTTRKRKGLVAASSKDQILFAVAESQHVLLDLARRTYQELVARIVEFGAVEINDIPGAQLCYSQSRGYHFSLHANDPYSINLPQQCIQVVFNKASLTFTTRDLIKYNDRLLQSENEILQKSNLVLDQLIASIREYIPALYKCAELVSLFDYYAALACYCSRVQAVRPSFGKELSIVQGRHPILDYRKDVVPNNTFASHSESRFAVIAGPNVVGLLGKESVLPWVVRLSGVDIRMFQTYSMKIEVVLPITEFPAGAMPLGAKGRAPTEPPLLGFSSIYHCRRGRSLSRGRTNNVWGKVGAMAACDKSVGVVPPSRLSSAVLLLLLLDCTYHTNMAGKSTYMRQVCMLQILAQMGCMVPAETATFVPMTRIFSRVGHNDNLVQNLSGFAVEVHFFYPY